MFSNYLAAALRNVRHNGFHAGLNIFCLAVGFAASIITALYVRDEFTYDRFFPGYENIYTIVTHNQPPDRAELISDVTPHYFAQWLKNDFPEVNKTSRLLMWERHSLRRGNVEISEEINWADPNFFDLVPLPVVAGNLSTSLERPDGIVLTRAAAEKYFGHEAPIGEVVELDRKYPLRVTAVIENLPSNTHLTGEVFLSGRAAFSPLAQLDAQTYVSGSFLVNVQTYIQLSHPNQASNLQEALPEFLRRHMRAAMESAHGKRSLELVRLSDLHLYPNNFGARKPHGNKAVLYGLAAVGFFILLIAAINFVNLMTATATQRALEVGVRKTYGAYRRDLIVQFIAESIIYAVFGMMLALAIIGVSLPAFNDYFQRTLSFNWWSNPWVFASILVLVVSVGVLAGAYPAFILSSFRPVKVIRESVAQATGSGAVRRILVISQFTILIVLIVGTVVVYKQTNYGLRDGLRFDKEQILLLYSRCDDSLINELRSIQGIESIGCSSTAALNMIEFNKVIALPKGEKIPFSIAPVGFGFFELYGLQPLAGRLFLQNRSADIFPLDPKGASRPGSIILNETGARAFGFSSVEQAIGSTALIDLERSIPLEVIGVVPDFTFDLLHRPVTPTIYVVSYPQLGVVSLKLRAGDLSSTLDSIDRVWRRVGDARPIDRAFLDKYIQGLYVDIMRQGTLITTLALIALVVGCLGLFGLSAFAAQRRTKEIGVRKALGADSSTILGMLLWDFTKPVLLANIIAWPLAYYLMNHWLEGFPYRISLQLWIFLGAGAFSLAIALLTVSMHAHAVARAKPIHALRNE